MIATGRSTSRWIVYPLLASLALAVSVFPRVDERSASPRDPFQQAVNITGNRYYTQSELLRRAHSRELARVAIAQTARSTKPVTIVRPADLPVAFQERVQAMIEPLLTLPQRDPHMRVVVALTADTGSTVAGAIVLRPWRSLRADIFPPGSIADGACTIVASAGRLMMLSPARLGERRLYLPRDIDAPCSWYAAYGSPGRGVANWLDSTHFEAIGRRSGSNSYGYSFGRFAQLAITACWAGREQACEALILRPLDRPSFDWYSAPVRTPGWIGSKTGSGEVPSNGFATSMLLGLEREIGAEGFATFWKSDQPLSVAFAAARGESLDAWVGRQVRGGFPAFHAGPLPATRVSIAWLIAVPGLLVLGVLGVAKRGEFA